MISTKKAISRRTVLRGIGTAVALPLLDAMVPALSAAQNTPAKAVRRVSWGREARAWGVSLAKVKGPESEKAA